MLLPGVNMLVYAFRTDTPQHDLSRRWLAISWPPKRLTDYPPLCQADCCVSSKPANLQDAHAPRRCLGLPPGSAQSGKLRDRGARRPPLYGDRRYRERRARRLLGRHRHRVRERWGDHGWRLRALPAPAVAPSVLSGISSDAAGGSGNPSRSSARRPAKSPACPRTTGSQSPVSHT